ncbi:hypothetical protein ACIBI9_40355 [Nonomuraea sp. NPDC050451]|uniref:hypothetical protein n=1 Tax=Nonomuraea sp. NPDC050451 TaxID=3364364 RepID=UPI00379B40AF
MKHYDLTPATPPLGEYLAVEGRRLPVHRAGPGGPADVVLPEGVFEHTQARPAVFDALAASVTDGEHRFLKDVSPSRMHIEADDAIVQAVKEIDGLGKTPGVPQARQPRLPEPVGILVTTGSRGDETNDREWSAK